MEKLLEFVQNNIQANTARLILDRSKWPDIDMYIAVNCIESRNKLKGKIQEKGYTLVPLQVYFKGSLVKVEIGLARGKKLYDKRADIAKKDQRRELEKDFKVKNLY